jgi:hypothetical protein
MATTTLASALATVTVTLCPEGLQIRYPAESQIRSEVLWSMPGAEEAILRAADLDPAQWTLGGADEVAASDGDVYEVVDLARVEGA